MQNWLIFMILFYGVIIVAGLLEFVIKKVAKYIYRKIGISYLKANSMENTYRYERHV